MIYACMMCALATVQNRLISRADSLSCIEINQFLVHCIAESECCSE